jgi:hypothetical protein
MTQKANVLLTQATNLFFFFSFSFSAKLSSFP